MEKAKKEDFRVEEELRSQKVKYEEASDDVLRCRASCEHAMRQVNTGPSAFDSSGESKDIPASLSSRHFSL
jgi:hypothetical protein